MKQKNSHARSKQKRKALKMKSFQMRTFLNRASKLMGTEREDEVPVSALIGLQMQNRRSQFDIMNNRKRNGLVDGKFPNQRQRRKTKRQQLHGRKRAA